MVQASIIGAGVAGLTCALELAERGVAVEVLERAASLGAGSCSWYAGGMLAPWCERESAEPLIARLGAESIPWWREHFCGTVLNGTLVVAHGRDAAELAQFASRTGHFESRLDAEHRGPGAGSGRTFRAGAVFPGRGASRSACGALALAARLGELGIPIRFGVEASATILAGRPVIDCTGLAARRRLTDLRGVKGEMLLLRLREISPVPPGARAASAPAGLYRAASGWAFHGGRHHDRER